MYKVKKFLKFALGFPLISCSSSGVTIAHFPSQSVDRTMLAEVNSTGYD